MSTKEGSYKSLLQGVSQQIPSERLPGQVGAQENMLSDAVTNVRRRPGAEYAVHLAFPDATSTSIKAWFTDIAGQRVHVYLNCADGTVKILNELYVVQATLAGGAYLTTGNISNIQATTVGDEFYILNRSVAPVAGSVIAGPDPAKGGWYYIVAGAFSRKYEVTIVTSVGTISADYTTPSGSGGTDAANTTPEYIATQLFNTLDTNKATAGITALYRVGAYVYISSGTGLNCTVNTSTGSAYVLSSRARYTAASGNLPAQLPSQADGFIMAVGDTRTPQYYKYVSASTSWLECGQYGSYSAIQSMPVSITWNGTVWGFTSEPYEGRLAGDETSNPEPWFLTTGITGMSAYQGRLVLLAGGRANMSASNKPRRFFRSTVTSILDSDPIEVGSSANSSADYEYAVPFQKDLVLFSAAYQALVPSGNNAITPRTATVVLTSSHESDMSCPPVMLGRTLMYPAPKSKDFFGVLEMIPSQYTDSQYISQDATPHLPKYMGGRCRFSVSSSVANMALFAPSGDKQSLIVHEYLWDGDQKVQQSWHRWTFEYEVAAAYFASEVIVLLFVQNDVMLVCTIDPRVGVLTSASTRRPFLDFYSAETAVGTVYDVPTWLTDFDPLAADKVSLSVVSGNLAGDAVGFTKVSSTELAVVPSFSGADIAVGFTYRSSLSPSPPVVRDYNEVVVHSNKQTLLRYLIGTKNSSQFNVSVQDKNPADDSDADIVGTLTWSSAELALGRAKYSTESHAVVPCRTDAPSTVAEFYTEGTGELNVVSLEYVLKTHQKIKRG